jgi:hypothetical protein
MHVLFIGSESLASRVNIVASGIDFVTEIRRRIAVDNRGI